MVAFQALCVKIQPTLKQNTWPGAFWHRWLWRSILRQENAPASRTSGSRLEHCPGYTVGELDFPNPFPRFFPASGVRHVCGSCLVEGLRPFGRADAARICEARLRYSLIGSSRVRRWCSDHFLLALSGPHHRSTTKCTTWPCFSEDLVSESAAEPDRVVTIGYIIQRYPLFITIYNPIQKWKVSVKPKQSFCNLRTLLFLEKASNHGVSIFPVVLANQRPADSFRFWYVSTRSHCPTWEWLTLDSLQRLQVR